jgi:RNA polymerase sigma-70 factor (ECF subfamily)
MQASTSKKPDFGLYASSYRHVLMAFFLRRVADRAEAEDLTHDALIRLASAAPRAIDNPNAYVFQVAANLLRDRKRRKRVRDGYLAAIWESERERVESRDPSRVAASCELMRSLQAALEELPARSRNIFLSYRLERVGKPEIAALYGISISAVDKHLMRAMAHVIRRTEASR